MTVDLKEFKTRFGKKPVDAQTPQQRYDARLKALTPKIKAVIGRGDAAAIERIKQARSLADGKRWDEALIALDEMDASAALDKRRAGELRGKLDAAWLPAKAYAKAPPALEGLRRTAEAALSEDRYDDAADAIDDVDAAVKASETERLAFDAKSAQVAENLVAGHVWATKEERELRAAFDKLASEMRAAATACEYATAHDKAKALLVKGAELAAGAGSQTDQQRYDARWSADRAALEAIAKRIGDGAFGSPPVGSLAAPAKALTDALAASLKAAGSTDPKTALAELDKAAAALGALRAAAVAEHSAGLAAAGGAARVDQVVKALNGKGPLPSDLPGDKKKACDDFKALNARRGTAFISNRDFLTAIELWRQQEPLLRTLWPSFDAMNQAEQNTKDQAARQLEQKYQNLIKTPDRKQLADALLDPTADLDAFRRQPGATKLLDDLVRDLGGKADNADKKRFVQAAIMARFGLKEMSGGDDKKGLSTKALPKLYQVLALVPDTHLADNPELETFERQKDNDTSYYSNNKKKIVLKAGKSGKAGSNFDQTTLHEVGHAVDHRFDFMGKNGQARCYGGWVKSSLDEVLAVAGGQLGFYKDFEAAPHNVPRALLEKFLRGVLGGADPQKLKAQFEAVKNPSSPDALKNTLKTHAALKRPPSTTAASAPATATSSATCTCASPRP